MQNILNLHSEKPEEIPPTQCKHELSVELDSLKPQAQTTELFFAQSTVSFTGYEGEDNVLTVPLDKQKVHLLCGAT